MSEYEGHENLETAIKRINFTKWVLDETFQFLHGDILEIGSGLGTYSRHLIETFPNSQIHLTDISSNYVNNLKSNFLSKNTHVSKLDLNNLKDCNEIGYDKFDSIIGINVLEHIKDDGMALSQMYKMLKKNGTLVILVPANKFLYNVIDESIGHWRRYTKKEIHQKLEKNSFNIKKIYSFNILGILGWFLNGNILKKKEINKNASSIFDKIIPIMRMIEPLGGRHFGLSIISISKK